jgi:hypothetical protein
VNGHGIRLPLLNPEKRPRAIAKTPQNRVITLALVGQEEIDIHNMVIPGLQRRGGQKFHIGQAISVNGSPKCHILATHV